MMTKLNLMKPILAAVCTALLSFSLSAQVVRMTGYSLLNNLNFLPG